MTHTEIIRRQLDHSRWSIICRHRVEAVGLGYKTVQGRITGDLSIVCSVRRKYPAAKLGRREMIPARLGGIPTDVVEVHRLHALGTPALHSLSSRGVQQTDVLLQPDKSTMRYRPTPGGVSIAHSDVAAGTLGCLVQKEGEIFLLSNNHIFAGTDGAKPGDPILQPAVADGGDMHNDVIARLHQSMPIRFADAPSFLPLKAAAAFFARFRNPGTTPRFKKNELLGEPPANRVDCALARPENLQMVSPEIREIGTIKGNQPALLGMEIRKCGRTTGLTTGVIRQTDVSAWVHYGQNRSAWFTDQLIAGPMSLDGDSGAAVVTGDNRLTGLLFAGSDRITLINRMEHVMSALHIQPVDYTLPD